MFIEHVAWQGDDAARRARGDTRAPCGARSEELRAPVCAAKATQRLR